MWECEKREIFLLLMRQQARKIKLEKICQYCIQLVLYYRKRNFIHAKRDYLSLIAILPKEPRKFNFQNKLSVLSELWLRLTMRY